MASGALRFGLLALIVCGALWMHPFNERVNAEGDDCKTACITECCIERCEAAFPTTGTGGLLD